MALSKDSIRKLRAVKAAILAEPELYGQDRSPYCQTSCDSPCCIAGWALWVNNPDPEAYAKIVNFTPGATLLRDQIGLTEEQASLLFTGWPSTETPAWLEPGTKAAARDAAKHIELFIKGGGAWPEAA